MKFNTLGFSIALTLLSSNAFAAAGERIDATIQVTSTVASDTFSVTPLGKPNFNDVKAVLDYEKTTGVFTSWDMTIEAKYEVGLSAALATSPTLFNGTDYIPLTIDIDAASMSTTFTEINSVSVPGTGETSTHVLSISAADDSSLSSGLYTGSVSLIFEDSI